MKKVAHVVKYVEVQNVDNMRTWIEELFHTSYGHEMEPISKEILIERGRCCALGCKNCPYTKPRVEGNQKLE